jgi:MoxR-like ATPase
VAAAAAAETEAAEAADSDEGKVVGECELLLKQGNAIAYLVNSSGDESFMRKAIRKTGRLACVNMACIDSESFLGRYRLGLNNTPFWDEGIFARLYQREQSSEDEWLLLEDLHLSPPRLIQELETALYTGVLRSEDGSIRRQGSGFKLCVTATKNDHHTGLCNCLQQFEQKQSDHKFPRPNQEIDSATYTGSRPPNLEYFHYHQHFEDAVNSTLNALACRRPVLLVGTGGCGKSAVVEAVANERPYEVQRITNETTVHDLLSKQVSIHETRDGALLKACKALSWVVLDDVTAGSDKFLQAFEGLLKLLQQGIEEEEGVKAKQAVLCRVLQTIAGQEGGEEVVDGRLGNRGEQDALAGPQIIATADAANFALMSDSLKKHFSVIHFKEGVTEEDHNSDHTVLANLPRIAISMLRGSGIVAISIEHVISLAESLREHYSSLSEPERARAGSVLHLLSSVIRGGTQLWNDRKHSTSESLAQCLHTACCFCCRWHSNHNLEKKQDCLSRIRFSSDSRIVSAEKLREQGCFVDETDAESPVEAVLFCYAARLPLLLEGPPGVGKTHVINRLAKATAQGQATAPKALEVVMNTDSTTVGDYWGRFHPKVGSFELVDGPLLLAIKEGSWFLADELNLAPVGVHTMVQQLLEELARPRSSEVIA